MPKKQTTGQFEDHVQRLQEIVTALDSENVTLGDTIKLYEEGIQLLEKSVKELSSAQMKIKELHKRADGVFELLDAEPDVD
jgi:exodeoxyribonuclease VII small subunit